MDSLRIAVCDSSSAAWLAGGEVSRIQLLSLLMASSTHSDADIAFMTGGAPPQLPTRLAGSSVASIPRPAIPRLNLKEQVWQSLARRAGRYSDPRLSAWVRWCRQYRLDVLLSFYPPDWWRPSRVGVCCWIPDFQHLYLPQYFSREDVQARNEDYARIAELADLVILSSQTAKADFEKFLPARAGKARLFRFPSRFAFDAPAASCDARSVRERYNIEERFFLVVNQFFAHKNHRQVLEAAHILLKQGKCPQVVMVGSPVDFRDKSGATMSRLLGAVAELRLEGRVKILGFVPAEVRDILQRACTAVIQPSEFEGWSTTIQDAKALGRPVLASDIPLHREQIPKAFGFFEIGNAEQLATLMRRAAETLQLGPDREKEVACLDAATRYAEEEAVRLLGHCREAKRLAAGNRP